MKVIIDTINGALQENLDSIVLLIIVTGILYLANITLRDLDDDLAPGRETLRDLGV